MGYKHSVREQPQRFPNHRLASCISDLYAEERPSLRIPYLTKSFVISLKYSLSILDTFVGEWQQQDKMSTRHGLLTKRPNSLNFPTSLLSSKTTPDFQIIFIHHPTGLFILWTFTRRKRSTHFRQSVVVVRGRYALNGQIDTRTCL